MKYAIVAAFCAAAVHAQCADPVLTGLKAYKDDKCTEESPLPDGMTQEMMDKGVAEELKKLNKQITDLKACKKAPSSEKEEWGDLVKSYKGNDCADNKFEMLGYSDDACMTVTPITGTAKDKVLSLSWGVCKKDGAGVYSMMTDARAMTASVAAATFAIAASLY